MAEKLINPRTGKELINPKTDFAFKKLFASDFEKSKRRLLSLINSFVAKDHKMVSIKEINVINPYNMATYTEGKETILDIKAFDEKGRWYNIEMQVDSDREYFKRALFYWSRIYAQNFSEGDEYTKLKRTIGIHFLDFNYIEPQKYIKSTKYHHRISMRDIDNPDMIFYGMDICEIHLIELRKLDKNKVPEDSAEEWIKFFADTVSCIVNEGNIKTEEIKETLYDLDKLNLIDEERAYYEESLKRISDQNTLLSQAEKRGENKGREEGRKEGREEGVKQRNIEIAKNLKSQGLSNEQISGATGLTKEEIEKL